MDILYYMDGRKEQERKVDAVKTALLAAGSSPESVYPEYFGGSTDPIPEGNEVVYDYAGVKWESPMSTGAEGYERLKQQMADHRYISLVERDDSIPEQTRDLFPWESPQMVVDSVDAEWT